MLDRLPDTAQAVDTPRTSKSLEESVLKERTKARRLAKTFMNNAGIVVGIFIMFAVLVIVTTDIRLASFEDIAALGLDFFLLIFCSYAMYISCADSGMRAGLCTKSYKEIVKEYEAHLRYLLGHDLQSGLYDFCRQYVEDELKNARMNVLAVACFTYDDYLSNWMNKSDKEVMAEEHLTDTQKKAVIRANHIRPIKFAPDHIVHMGRNDGGRAPLGMAPRTKKKLNFAMKFAKILFTSVGVIAISLEVVTDPTWRTFASATIKLLTVAINGFNGFKYGYENVVVDTREYVSDQTYILQQAIKYIEKESSTNAHKRQEGGDTNLCASGISASE